MTDLTSEQLDRLQRLRASLTAFQQSIGALPADRQSNAHNVQFNQLLFETRSLLPEEEVVNQVSPALTDETLAAHAQKDFLPRLSGVVILGVILVLTGLGINSIILEDMVINSVACCISSGGMLLVVGALAVLGIGSIRRRLTDLGELYQRCDTLLYQINHALNMVIPDWADRSQAEEIPPIPSVVELALDSLQKQAADWQQKLTELETDQVTVGPDTPMELSLNIDFVRRKLQAVRTEIDRLQGRDLAEEEPLPETETDASAVTIPPLRPVEDVPWQPQEEPRPREDTPPSLRPVEIEEPDRQPKDIQAEDPPPYSPAPASSQDEEAITPFPPPAPSLADEEADEAEADEEKP